MYRIQLCIKSIIYHDLVEFILGNMDDLNLENPLTNLSLQTVKWEKPYGHLCQIQLFPELWNSEEKCLLKICKQYLLWPIAHVILNGETFKRLLLKNYRQNKDSFWLSFLKEIQPGSLNLLMFSNRISCKYSCCCQT